MKFRLPAGSAAYVIPFLVFLISHYFSLKIAERGNCWAGIGELCWSRWDSALYLDIVKQGHTLIPCAENPDTWCGNAGWAPFYPLLIKLLTYVGIYAPLAGLIISKISFLAYLFVSAKLWQVNGFQAKNWILMLITAFAPGSIYFHAIFPLSTAVFFMALTHWFLKNEKWFFAGIASMFGILSYSIGFFLLISFAFYGIILWQKQRINLKPFIIKTVLPASLGLIIWFGYDLVATGHWDALFKIQSKYGHGLNSPLKFLGVHLKRLFSGPFELKTWIEVQNMLVLILVIAINMLLWLKKSDNYSRFSGIYMFFFWMFPFSASADVALYRNCAMLGPSFNIFNKLKTRYLILLLVMFLILWYPMGILFIQSILV